MTILVPMDAATFDRFAAVVVSEYAHDNVIAGRWLGEGALARARGEFERLLPRGLSTPEHHLLAIRESAEGQLVGHVWLHIFDADGERAGYLFNIRVEQPFRGHGHAARALQLLDEFALGHGVQAMRLHVFAINTRAQALYRAAGYGCTGMQMLKRLRTDG